MEMQATPASTTLALIRVGNTITMLQVLFLPIPMAALLMIAKAT